MLNPATQTYAYPSYPWQEDGRGFYIPDSVVHSFVERIRRAAAAIFDTHIRLDEAGIGLSPLNRHRLLIPEPAISLEKSRRLVLQAFGSFTPFLQTATAAAMNDPSRWEFKNVPPGEACGGCLAGNCQENPHTQAVIDYEYDGTINDTIYIAHEIGHLQADDLLTSENLNYTARGRHMSEIQAFFTQSIVYDFLLKTPDPSLQNAARIHFTGEVARSLYDVCIGLCALDVEKSASGGIRNEAQIRAAYESGLQILLGKNWQHYQKAVWMAENIHDEKSRDISISALHQHSMAALVAMGLFEESKKRGREERQTLSKAILTARGQFALMDVLKTFGIETERQIGDMAETVITAIAGRLGDIATNPDCKNRRTPAPPKP